MPLMPRAMLRKWSLGNPLKSMTGNHGGLWRGRQGTRQDHGDVPVWRHAPPSTPSAKVYGSIGALEVRLAASRAEVRAAQRLRYNVFFEEMSATPSMKAYVRRRDADSYDRLCDHLLVVDKDRMAEPVTSSWPRRRTADPAIVGTYRILRQDVAERHDGFYSQGEYNIAPLLAAKSGIRFMELGRSCVSQTYRTKRTVELLWHGLWTYIRENGVDAMIGCASFEGVDPDRHAQALSFLHHHALAPTEWRARAHETRWVAMDRCPRERIDVKAAMKAMPPLIKGYLRLGAYFGDGAVIDHAFGTTDVLVILPVERIDPRYFARFGAPDEMSSRIGPEAGAMM